jgi:hypothetical protein
MTRDAIWVGLFLLTTSLAHGQGLDIHSKEFLSGELTFPATFASSAGPSQVSSEGHETVGSASASKTGLLGPRIKNPYVSSEGLDADVLGTLLRQRTYFERSAGLNAHAAAKPALAPWVNTAVVGTTPCRSPMIRVVNGKSQGAVFTPRPPNNLYRIEGCFFGKIRGHVQLEPHPTSPGQSALPIALQLDASLNSWSENEIDVYLDPHLSGIADTPVTLVIYPGRGQRMELPGCLFVAARGAPQLLTAIPSSWVEFYASTTRSHSLKQIEYVSPPARGRDVPDDARSASAFVNRSDSQPFTVGRDIYDFSRLNPGWVVDSVQVQTYVPACPGPEISQQSSGEWETQWRKSSFAVALRNTGCTSSTTWSSTFSTSLSQYAVNVWVIGPVGTQPVPAMFVGKLE